mmetsp:Transcript_6602/g.12428  ORF Transcript_6602/g.12428 Transcript_6602/m.12428 type:complete len:221 (+) Transcript_6602:364-1026(+)
MLCYYAFTFDSSLLAISMSICSCFFCFCIASLLLPPPLPPPASPAKRMSSHMGKGHLNASPYSSADESTQTPPSANIAEGSKPKRGMQMSVPMTVERAFEKHFRMLSAYLTTSATMSPPTALFTPRPHTTASKPRSGCVGSNVDEVNTVGMPTNNENSASWMLRIHSDGALALCDARFSPPPSPLLPPPPLPLSPPLFFALIIFSKYTPAKPDIDAAVMA